MSNKELLGTAGQYWCRMDKKREKINVWGNDCDACKITDEFFKTKREVYKYKKYNLNNPITESILSNLYPNYSKDKSTPVIQRCTLDNNGKVKKCSWTQGFKQSDYE